MKKQFITMGIFATSTLPVLAVTMPSLAQSPQQQVREISVTVERATTEHNFDPNLSPLSDDQKPDFYTSVTISGETRNSQVITNRKDAPFNFVHTKRLNSPVGNAHPFVIKLLDSDKVTGDEEADINPGSNRSLTFFYQPSTGQILSGDLRTVVGQAGKLITFRGNESGKNATITFRVNHVLR